MNLAQSDILEQVGRGELSAAAAVRLLGEANAPALATEDEDQPIDTAAQQNEPVITRSERLRAVAQRVGAWEPQAMVAPLPGQCAKVWPWPEQPWQWFWQDFSRPLHVNQELNMPEGSQLEAVLYDGKIECAGVSAANLHIGAAAFDLRLGRDERQVRLAASTGSVILGVPQAVTQVQVHALPGDVWLRDLQAQQVQVVCKSGDFRAERIQAELRGQVQGGTIDLVAIEGAVHIEADQGRIRARQMVSDRVELRADEGIVLELERLVGGHFRCVTQGGDIEIMLAKNSACQIKAQVGEQGAICPVDLPWSTLTSCAPGVLEGTLGGGGAHIELVSENGRIFITGH